MRPPRIVAQTAARGKPALRTSALALVSLAAVVVGLLLVAPARAGDLAPVETKFVGQLRAVSGEATSAQSQVAGLKKSGSLPQDKFPACDNCGNPDLGRDLLTSICEKVRRDLAA